MAAQGRLPPGLGSRVLRFGLGSGRASSVMTADHDSSRTSRSCDGGPCFESRVFASATRESRRDSPTVRSPRTLEARNGLGDSRGLTAQRGYAADYEPIAVGWVE